MRTQPNYTIPCGLLLLAICLFIRYQIGKRRFNRRGVGGVEHFSTYGKAIFTGLLERLLLLIGNGCGLAGLILLALAGFNNIKF